jgi:hypothetical protein
MGRALDDVPAFSRSGSSNPLGKCTAQLSCLVPEEVKERFTALAVMKSGGVSEYLRDIVMREVMGEFELMRLKANGRSVRSAIAEE